MKIAIKSKKPLRDDKLGRLMYGDVIDLPEHKAQFYLQRGEASAYDTKVVIEQPYVQDVVSELVQEEPKKRGRKTKQV
jgi:hypothetical protein